MGKKFRSAYELNENHFDYFSEFDILVGGLYIFANSRSYQQDYLTWSFDVVRPTQ